MEDETIKPLKEAFMTETVRLKNTGLRGVTVADTKIGYIDGENGILVYRGYRIEELALNSTFEETAYLLLHGTLPNGEQLEAFKVRLVEARQVPPFIYDSFKSWPKHAHPMDVIQASIPLLAIADPDLAQETRDANISMAIRLIARIPALIASWHRMRIGLDIIPPDDSLSHAGNFLLQLTGMRPDPEIEHDFDTCLILHAEHTFNASTFACREVVSTRAHMYAGAAAGVGALSGSLHGGANAKVMKMLLELQAEKDIPSWVKNQLDQGKRIMGMGHAVYKTMDPRARFLKDICYRLGKKLGEEQWYRLSSQIEDAAVNEFNFRGKTTIKPNCDFYSAPVYHIMGIDADLMTPVFTASRIAGWCAHMIEEKFAEAQEKPALYRPSSEYVGHYCGLMGCVYEPIKQR